MALVTTAQSWVAMMRKEAHRLEVLIGELLAVAAILMCLAFVTVDLGRPDRFWHIIPGIGRFNWPQSRASRSSFTCSGSPTSAAK